MIESAIAIVQLPTGQFPILLRYPEDKVFNGWCLPGGKLDEGETPEECVIREVFEETGYEIEINKKLMETETLLGNRKYKIHAFLTRKVGGALKDFPTEEHIECREVLVVDQSMSVGQVARQVIEMFEEICIWR